MGTIAFLRSWEAKAAHQNWRRAGPENCTIPRYPEAVVGIGIGAIFQRVGLITSGWPGIAHFRPIEFS